MTLTVLASPGLVEGERANPFLRAFWGSVAEHDVELVSFTRRRLLARRRPDLVHVHWPEALLDWRSSRPRIVLEAVKVVGLLALAKMRGTRLVWTAHNLGPHEAPHPRLFAVFWRAFGSLVDHVLLLSGASRDSVLERYPWFGSVPMTVVPHGDYRAAYPSPPSRAAAREALGLPQEGLVVLTAGQLRRYKRIDELAHAFVAGALPRATLVVAGSVVDPELEAELVDLADRDPRLVLRLGWLEAEDLSQLHAAADVVVLPYESPSVLNSGSAILSVSLLTPVVVPDTREMRDLRETVGHQWVSCFAGGPDRALAAAASTARESRPDGPDLTRLDWSDIGRRTFAAYRQTARTARQAPRGGRDG